MRLRGASPFALLAGALVLVACAGNPPPKRGPQLRQVAQPGEIVAVELAFARMAREEGQRAAFLHFAAEEALLFTPAPVRAKEWLQGNDLPAEGLAWQPHRVWSSCDGSLAAAGGAWQAADGSFGDYITVWQRQEDGSYRWVIDEGGTLEQPLEEPQMVQAEVAECDPAPQVSAVDPAADRPGGAARDRTLSWTIQPGEDGSRRLVMRLWNGSEGEAVLSRTYPGPAR